MLTCAQHGWKIHMHDPHQGQIKAGSHVWKKKKKLQWGETGQMHIHARAHTAAWFPTLPKCFYGSFVVTLYGPSSVQAGLL